MNPESIIETIRDVIEKRQNSPSFRWLLCWCEGRLQCRPVENPHVDTITFKRLTQHQIEEGFCSSEWWRLTEKVMQVAKVKT